MQGAAVCGRQQSGWSGIAYCVPAMQSLFHSLAHGGVGRAARKAMRVVLDMTLSGLLAAAG